LNPRVFVPQGVPLICPMKSWGTRRGTASLAEGKPLVQVALEHAPNIGSGAMDKSSARHGPNQHQRSLPRTGLLHSILPAPKP